MTHTWIIAARRSAVIPRGGAFAALDLHDLAVPVIHGALADACLDPVQVDELVLANALGAGGNPARLIALAANLPQHVAGLTIDRQCVGGLDAILLADTLIRAGHADVILAGGVESYSRRPLRLRTFADNRTPEPYDQPPFAPTPAQDPNMAEAANALARSRSISRGAQDAFAIQSHASALAAQSRMVGEITPIAGIVTDPFTRRLSQKTCARATPIAGSITAANAAVAADAAAICVVVSDKFAARFTGPKARISAGATLGADPAQPGIAPVAAIRASLTTAGIEPGDLKVIEMMEAYAVQAMACIEEVGLNPARTNLGGGALSRGHPIGASGAINAVRLFHELQRSGGSGLAAIAAAGGLGTALVLGG
ncbi:thiolase family protein [Pseudohalocynthiibacter aestuariivivens]|nr:thiolase family protein [Pseudohalocynthiibacter aestuariivivens]QIE45866.1 thiolase family protein [Pseudohalocynthiibacter aestuariivivens]